jgi:hypothetical protein
VPTVLRAGPYRFYFYSHDAAEPPHVHVDRDALTAKFWLDPVRLARNIGFHRREVGRIKQIVMRHESEIQEAWREFFDD